MNHKRTHAKSCNWEKMKFTTYLACEMRYSLQTFRHLIFKKNDLNLWLAKPLMCHRIIVIFRWNFNFLILSRRFHDNKTSKSHNDVCRSTTLVEHFDMMKNMWLFKVTPNLRGSVSSRKNFISVLFLMNPQKLYISS